MQKYWLVFLDASLLGVNILFGISILGLDWCQAMVVGVSLYLMFSTLVAMLFLSVSLLDALQRRYRIGVLRGLLLPWSTTLIAMAAIPELLKGRHAENSINRHQ